MKIPPNRIRKAGFSLLEVSIVLVVVALLAAGVVLGRNLQQEAAKRAVVAEIDKYIAGMHLFAEKYHQLPGDFSEAEEYWGADQDCPDTDFNEIPKQATCNGDGNGTVGSFTGTAYLQTHEWYRGWQHMANAGVIDGQFSGVMDYVDPRRTLGTSIPLSVTGGGYSIRFSYSAGDSQNYMRAGQSSLELGAMNSACEGGALPQDCITSGPILVPSDAQEIDQKIDDGTPGSGKVVARPPGFPGTPDCTDGSDPVTSGYKTSFANVACSLIISTGF